ncbi:hypothetical protein [Pseudolactococcus insecticola]|uniref:Uncharacterized protein n=1 Tax=Pseudolactococcus insecticola TaxID=2709158 RepID=A0A6A0B7G6_9LACT|nr:hypothetical protein [Lactococcus insecticola]GFH40705.1 hypothetical protein Hs20B_11030 [Lactococcus insecticola]
MEYKEIKKYVRKNVEITTKTNVIRGFYVQSDLDDNEEGTDLIWYVVLETPKTDITGEVELIPISEIKSIEVTE